MLTSLHLRKKSKEVCIKTRSPAASLPLIGRVQGGLAAIFDLAAFRQAMIAPVKKSVNHSKTVTSMREIGMIRAIRFVRGDSTVENELAFS